MRAARTKKVVGCSCEKNSERFQIYILALLVVVVLYTIDDLIYSEETSAN